MVISRTPVRLSFFGGGTDYREYFERKCGAVLGTTIDKYTYVSVNPLSDFFEYRYRVGYSKAELVNEVHDIVHPSVRETLKFMKVSRHLDIHIFADLPARTGLGSSSSFTVGFLNALYALEGKAVSKQRLAEESIHIEQKLIAENVGCQDQVHAAYGGFNIIEFNADGITARPVVITHEKRTLLDESLLVFYTSLTRYATEVLKEQVENTRSCSKDDYLEAMYAMVNSAEKIMADASADAMLAQLGSMLHESWQHKKCLSSQVSNPTIDAIYDKAIKAGAYGGKLAGAGSGGFLFFLVAKDKQASVRSALKDLKEVKFRFESEGSKIIYINE